MSLSLVPLEVPVLRRLATGDLVAAGRSLGMVVPPSVLDLQWVWATFADRMEAEPEHALWRTQYFAVEDRRIVADLRTHAPPAADGMVSFGYFVVPVERGRGVATAASRLLLDDVVGRPGVRVVKALVNPANAPSLAVCSKLGLVDVGTERHRMTGQIMRRLERPVDPSNARISREGP